DPAKNDNLVAAPELSPSAASPPLDQSSPWSTRQMTSGPRPIRKLAGRVPRRPPREVLEDGVIDADTASPASKPPLEDRPGGLAPKPASDPFEQRYDHPPQAYPSWSERLSTCAAAG